MNKLLIIGGAALAAYVFVPEIRSAIDDLRPLFFSGFSTLHMRLDPNEQNQIEDRRGQHGRFPRGAPWGGQGEEGDDGFSGGGFRGGGMGGFPGEGGMGDPAGGFPGGGRGGGGLRCRDTWAGRDVSMSFCQREQGGRR
jgi:hypothetical protein